MRMPPFSAKNVNLTFSPAHISDVHGGRQYFYLANSYGILWTILWTKGNCIAMKIEEDLTLQKYQYLNIPQNLAFF